MSLTKEHIIDNIYNATDLKRGRSAQLFESCIEIIKSTLESGDDVLISGFGKFCVNEKKKRRGRNPQTGEDLILKPRKVVTFQCSSVLRDKINGKA